MTLMFLAAAAAATFSFGEVKVDSEDRDGWKLELSREVAPDGAEIAKITLDCAEAKVPPKMRLSAPNSAENPDIEANYGMAQDSADGTPTPKPAFVAYRFLISMMPPGSSKVSRKVLKNGVHVAEWHRPDKSRVLAAWHPTASVQITPRREPRAAFDQYGNPIHAKTDGAIPVGNSVVYFVYGL